MSEPVFSILAGVVVSVTLGLWSYLSVQVIRLGRDLVSLQEKVSSQAHTCVERLAWIKEMDVKLSLVVTDTAVIKSILQKGAR
jgi:hypothetical protein